MNNGESEFHSNRLLYLLQVRIKNICQDKSKLIVANCEVNKMSEDGKWSSVMKSVDALFYCKARAFVWDASNGKKIWRITKFVHFDFVLSTACLFSNSSQLRYASCKGGWCVFSSIRHILGNSSKFKHPHNDSLNPTCVCVFARLTSVCMCTSFLFLFHRFSAEDEETLTAAVSYANSVLFCEKNWNSFMRQHCGSINHSKKIHCH